MNGIEIMESVEGLRTALDLADRERTYLYRTVSAVGSTLELDEVLRNIVNIVTEATGCHASFIYLWDKEKERLVLRATNDPYQHLVGVIQLSLGEGITGWCALALEPVMIRERVLEDPRNKYFPELEEEKFQSMLAVPMVSRSNNLVGIISLHTVAPYEFSDTDLNLVTTTASLVAGAIENAQLFQSTKRKLAILTTLSDLSQTICSTLGLKEILKSLAAMTTAIMESDAYLILLTDSNKERLTVGASWPPWLLEKNTSDQITARHGLWDEIIKSASPVAIDLSKAGTTMGQLAFLKEGRFASMISAPLVSGTEHLGLINCYTTKTRKYNAEDLILLGTIANQTAIAIKNAQLIDMLTERNLIRDFFEELVSGTPLSETPLSIRAAVLGCDLSKPHVPIVIQMAAADLSNTQYRISDAGAFGALKREMVFLQKKLIERYPSSLFHEMDRTLLGLLRVAKGDPNETIKDSLVVAQRGLENESGVQVAIGIGNLCQAISEYRQGFAEAKEALQIGQAIWGTRAVVCFNDLGVYRYLHKMSALDDTRDPFQARLHRLIKHDKDHHTELFKTLEAYLECLGNASHTAGRLYIHRNTLCQRLSRILAVSGIDPYDTQNWLALQIAVKVVRLRGK